MPLPIPVRDRARQIAAYLPYMARQKLIEHADRGYFNWLQNYVFLEKQATIAQLQYLGCLFVHIPKCAGNSINNGLLNVPSGMGHLSIFDYAIALTQSEFESLFKFTFVRNPWERLVSAYFFMQQGGWRGRDRNWVARNIPFDTFDRFVKHWVTPSNVRRHAVFRPQIDFITLGGQLQVDFVGRCERMQQDLTYIANRINVQAELLQENATLARPDYRDLYDARAKDIVAQVYHQDIERLEYDF